MRFYEPEPDVEQDEEARVTAYMRRHFRGGDQDPGERLADLAGVEVADLEDGDVVDAVAKRLPGTGR